MDIKLQKKPKIAPCTNCKTPTEKAMICPECDKEFCGACFIGLSKSGTGQVGCPHCKKKVFLPTR